MRVDFTRTVTMGDRLTVVGFGQRGSSERAPYGVRYQRAVSVVDWSAREFMAGRSVCHGDSGGPALDPRTGAVVGVLSRGSEPCTARDAMAIWTHVSVAKSLIAAARRND
jgi:secreted trypsin-like serine protease